MPAMHFKWGLEILIAIVVKHQILLLIGSVSKAAINVRCKYSNANKLNTGIKYHWDIRSSMQV